MCQVPSSRVEFKTTAAVVMVDWQSRSKSGRSLLLVGLGGWGASCLCWRCVEQHVKNLKYGHPPPKINSNYPALGMSNYPTLGMSSNCLEASTK